MSLMRCFRYFCVIWIVTGSVQRTFCQAPHGQESWKDKNGKLHINIEFVLPSACGSGLDHNSQCGSCVRTPLGAITRAAQCGRICLALPTNLDETAFDFAGQADEDRLGASYRPCGAVNSPGPCKIGWAEFKGVEWYAKTHRLCGSFKNWDSDGGRKFLFSVGEK